MSEKRLENIQIGQDTVSCLINYVNKKNRHSISFTIDVSGNIKVSAHRSLKFSQIESLIKSNQEWIIKKRAEHLAKFAQKSPIRYRHNDQLYFLGVNYPLQYALSNKNTVKVELTEQAVLYLDSSFDINKVKTKILQWYRLEALTYFTHEIQRLIQIPEVDWVESMPEVKVRSMKRQWGNCSSNGVITLNTHLIKVPQELIAYVLLHELCHLKEANHGPQFYALMAKVSPNYKQLKKELKNHIYHLFNLS